LQCVAVCCSVLQCVAVCCSVLQCVAVCCSVLQCVAVCCSVPFGAICISIKNAFVSYEYIYSCMQGDVRGKSPTNFESQLQYVYIKKKKFWCEYVYIFDGWFPRWEPQKYVDIYIHIYIYIWLPNAIDVCVCVCVCVNL